MIDFLSSPFLSSNTKHKTDNDMYRSERNQLLDYSAKWSRKTLETIVPNFPKNT